MAINEDKLTVGVSNKFTGRIGFEPAKKPDVPASETTPAASPDKSLYMIGDTDNEKDLWQIWPSLHPAYTPPKPVVLENCRQLEIQGNTLKFCFFQSIVNGETALINSIEVIFGSED